MSKALLRIGAGAAFSDDRIAPAVDLAERGELDYLVFECLAERTIARENLTRAKQPEKGYTPRLFDRMGAVLPACVANDVRIVSNMGAANPLGAAQANSTCGWTDSPTAWCICCAPTRASAAGATSPRTTTSATLSINNGSTRR